MDVLSTLLLKFLDRELSQYGIRKVVHLGHGDGECFNLNQGLMVAEYLVRDFLTPLCNKKNVSADECLTTFKKTIDMIKGTSFVVERRRRKEILGRTVIREVEIKKVI